MAVVKLRGVSVSGNQTFAQTGPCWNCSSLSPPTLKFLKAALRLSPPQAFAWACSLLLLHPCSLSSPEGLIYWPTPEKNSYFPIQPKPQPKRKSPTSKIFLRCPWSQYKEERLTPDPTDKTSICPAQLILLDPNSSPTGSTSREILTPSWTILDSQE